MLLGPDVQVTPLRLPAAEELSKARRLAVRQGLSSALAAWAGAGLMGMQLGQVRRATDADGLSPTPGAVAWRTDALGLVLPPTLAASLVCLSLGGQPDSEGGPLTGLDLAVLDIWARQALAAVAGWLELEPGASERAAPAELLSTWQWPALVAQIESAGGQVLLLVGWQQVAPGRRSGAPRLGDRPELLRGLRVPVEARLSGAEVPLADLLAAAEGDVVLLGRQADAEVGLYVGGQRIARGRPGVRSGRLAMRVDRTNQETLGGERRP